MSAEKITYTGSCHCGEVAFEVQALADLVLTECNCSICYKQGFIELLVAEEDINILKGEDNLTLYRFNTMVARHTFCKTCGVKPFYRPRSNPDMYSVNARCIDSEKAKSIRTVAFDGQNWEESIAAGTHYEGNESQ